MKKLDLDDPSYANLLSSYKGLFDHVIDLMHLQVFSPEEYIVREQEEVASLRFLLLGKAKIAMIHEDGNRSIIHFVKPGEFIGELSFIGIETKPKDVIAINECVCLAIPMSQAKESLLRDPDFLLLINQYIGKKLLKRTWLNTKSRNYELKNRLAAYILMAECDGYYKEKHTETAEYLSISYRHLLHTLKSFLDKGLLVKEGRRYRINKIELESLAKDIND